MLQVWLPLNGNLNNQGLADVSVTSGTAKYKTGKIGNGLDLSSRIMFSCPKLVGLKQFTIMFWVKIEDDDSIASNWQDIFGIYEQKADGSSYGQFRAETYYTPKTVSLFGVHWHDNTNYGITSGTLPTHYTGDRGVWHHCAIVVDSDQFIKSYTDGVLKNEYTTGLEGGHLYNGVFWLGETNNIAGCVNDVRIYDHVLSHREVKEISKGLVLHYTLAMPGQENMAVGTKNLSVTAYKSNMNCSKRGSSTVRLNDYGFYESQVTNSFGGLCVYANQYNFQVGDTVTMSFYIYTNGSTKSYSFYPMMYNSSGTRDTSTGIQTSIDGGAYTTVNAKSFGSISSTVPERHYVTFIWNQNVKDIIDNGGSIELSIQIHGNWQTGDWGSIFGLKFERGSHPTPWIPNPSDTEYSALGFNDGIEYDVSGYNHNGTKYGAITYDADTPRYETSAVFNGSNAYIETDSLPLETKTISVWIKTTWASASGYKMVFHDKNTRLAIGFSDTRIITYVGSDAGTQFQTSGIYIANQWNHLVLVKTGDQTRVLYLNGVAVPTYGNNNWGGDLDKLNIGIRHYNGSYSSIFNGQISDFRAYTTALSADDVCDLYSVAASISDSGTLMTSEVSEL